MKKLMALLLAFLLPAAMLPGCSRTSGADGGKPEEKLEIPGEYHVKTIGGQSPLDAFKISMQAYVDEEYGGDYDAFLADEGVAENWRRHTGRWTSAATGNR